MVEGVTSFSTGARCEDKRSPNARPFHPDSKRDPTPFPASVTDVRPVKSHCEWPAQPPCLSTHLFRLLDELDWDDVELAFHAHVEDALLFRIGRQPMHGFTLRAEITAWFQSLNIIFAGHLIFWIALDYYGGEG